VPRPSPLPTLGTIQRKCLVRKLQRSHPPLFSRNHLQYVRTKWSLSPGLPSMPPQCQTAPPCTRNTHATSVETMAPWRRDPQLSMREGTRHSTSKPPLASDCFKNHALGDKWCCTSPSSDPGDPDLGFPPSSSTPADIYSKKDTHYRRVATSGAAIIWVRRPRSPLEQPEWSDATSEDDALKSYDAKRRRHHPPRPRSRPGFHRLPRHPELIIRRTTARTRCGSQNPPH
jgi:hypothetical protein